MSTELVPRLADERAFGRSVWWMTPSAGVLCPPSGKRCRVGVLLHPPLRVYGVTVRTDLVAVETEIVAFLLKKVTVLGHVGHMTGGAPLRHGLMDCVRALQRVVVALKTGRTGRFPLQKSRRKTGVGVMADEATFFERGVQLPLALPRIVVTVQTELGRCVG